MINKFSGRVPLWLHYSTGKVYKSKPKDSVGYIYFPSTSEYNCYKLLLTLFPKPLYRVLCHQTIKVFNHTWKIDFTVTALTDTGKTTLQLIAETLNEVEINTPLNNLYIEYKGCQDDNFRRQFTNFLVGNSIFCQRVILVSDSPSAFVIENLKTHKRVTHPICSVEYMRSVILSFNLQE